MSKLTTDDLKALYYAHKLSDYCSNIECANCVFQTDHKINDTYCRLRQQTPDRWNFIQEVMLNETND